MDQANKQTSYFSAIMILIAIIAVKWSFGVKATFYFVLLLVFGMFVYRLDELKKLVK